MPSQVGSYGFSQQPLLLLGSVGLAGLWINEEKHSTMAVCYLLDWTFRSKVGSCHLRSFTRETHVMRMRMLCICDSSEMYRSE